MPAVHTPPSPSSSGGIALAPAPVAHAGPSPAVVAAAPPSTVRVSDDVPRTNGSLALAEDFAPEPPKPLSVRNLPVTEPFEEARSEAPPPPSSARDGGVATARPAGAELVAVVPPAKEASAAGAQPVTEEGEELVAWRALIDRVRKVNPAVAATLDLGVPMTVTREKIVVGMEDESFEDVRVEQTDARTVLTAEARAYFGANTDVVFERAARGSKVGSIAYLDAAKRKQALIEARAAVENHVLVQHAIRALGAELKDVKLPAREE